MNEIENFQSSINNIDNIHDTLFSQTNECYCDEDTGHIFVYLDGAVDEATWDSAWGDVNAPTFYAGLVDFVYEI